MSAPKVWISILNWNGLDQTMECLESIYKQDYKNYRLIVVDNASFNDPSVIVQSRFRDVIVIRNKENLGFTGGHNVAMRMALENAADYIWLVNNDAVVDQSCLGDLVAAAESSDKVAMVSPTIYHYGDPTKTQFTGSFFDWQAFALKTPDESDNLDGIFQDGDDVCLWGTALLLKAPVLRRIGLLEEKYFAYWEDTELSLRAIRNGYRNVLCKSAKIYHIVSYGNSIDRGAYYHYYMARNKLLMAGKYMGRANFRKFARLEFGRQLIDIADYQADRYFQNRVARVHGYCHGVMAIGGKMPEVKNRFFTGFTRFALPLLLLYPYALSSIVKGDYKGLLRQLLGRIRRFVTQIKSSLGNSQ